ncbi:ribonuclease R [Streptococcus uberis]|uniref:Ribonuclease R n=1 Tax=Streptococcus uberis (strain ATCC BAA-854 / 0140J) TaxID=218495 RepID=B9DTZ6_STRU0|nr:ribonuclease R [Streptococcus uberis]KKF44616.1 ribonuclease R [Streptococcus uberis Ab71]KKF53648.1 ribonuclease R [Streptococcus uberis B190]KKF59121.1 ribonuclease R [Streptococcus uberis 6736]MEE3737702.1 ribonuclease R [Streptococcus uberis]CAR41270.1 putative exoribonuclease R [Streptococcus uberis 0140J]
MRENIIQYLKEHGKSDINTIAAALDMAGAKKFPSLIKEISQMESKRLLRFSDDGTIALRKPKEEKKEITIQGVFRANKAGFGFLHVNDDEDDMFIGRNDVGYAIDGDTVEVIVKKTGDRLKGTAAEAKVVGIVERSLQTVVGRFILDDEKPKYAGYIKSKNQKIQQKIYIKKEPVLLDGTEIIKVDIEKYPTRGHDYFVGNVRDIVGHQGDVGIDVLEVLESMDIVSEFPDDVLAEANAISDSPSSKDLIGRVDLRQEITFTIDGADAKDLDDAIHIKPLANGNYELGVHIADVSYYVTEGSALDREAVARGTSVYVTDRVVPMLPERLSNGICSLNPNVDRLTQSAIMEIDSNGRVLNHQICQSVIKTTYRMTYSAVNDMIAGNQESLETYAAIAESVEHMVKLHKILEKMRVKRGALNFDTSEARIIVNDKGMPVDIVVRQRGIAERMIESFMLAANECVAEHFAKAKLPFIYRIHEEPKAEKLQKFIDYASVFGIQIQGTANKITQEALQNFMAKVEGKPGAEVLNMMLLRSMQQARYSENNHGHYGLAAEYYTHFTSPIRRYPDLLVHRMIRDYTQATEDKRDHFAQVIPELASSSSRLERRAIDAERVVEAMKKAEYMEEYVGDEFDGIVASVVKFGLFVELPNTIEGLIHITSLPEYYQYNERTMTLQGEKSGKVFKVGQAIRVKLTKADKETGDIDFEYLPSEFDVIEKVSKETKSKAHNHKGPRHQKKTPKTEQEEKAGSKKRKSRKPFYKDVAKKKSRKRS